ncbi:MAG: Gfo/Idh/MocA family oxidoreductase [Clostridiales bacterium]|nr:Gfo/Idh/MocA family oxidoreductase [Clostridiales bacterium]
MNKIRVGVVGMGHRGRAMLKLAAEGFDQVVPAAACDILPHNWYEKQWLMPDSLSNMFPETKFYEDYDQMLDEANLDVVIVETGADIHADFCIKALQKNINVLSDIPNVASLDEAERLWKAAECSKAIISTGANPNYQRFAFLLMDFYKKGLLGKPYCMEAEYIHWSLPGSDENIHLNENGDWRRLLIPIRYCTHSLGPLLSILEEDLRYVSCFGTGQHSPDASSTFGENGSVFKKDDMMCAQFRTESGVVIRLMRNGRCRASIGHHSYRVFGTEGYMERIDRMGKPVIRYNSMRELDTQLKEIDGEFMPPAYENNPRATGHGGMDFAMLDYFFKAIQNGGPAPISLREGLAMTLPGIYAEESAKRAGQVLRMVYPWDEDWSTVIK